MTEKQVEKKIIDECCFCCAYAQSNEDGLHCYKSTRKKVKGTDVCDEYVQIAKDTIGSDFE